MTGGDVLGEAQTAPARLPPCAARLERISTSRRTPCKFWKLTPTRELAIQVAEAFQTHARHLRDFHVVPPTVARDDRPAAPVHARAVIVTRWSPDDHLKRGSPKLDDLGKMVLDEADEMLRMGFIEDVEDSQPHAEHPPDRAVLATMPRRSSAALPSATSVTLVEIGRSPAATSTVSTTCQSY